jgi:hypothetical protein
MLRTKVQYVNCSGAERQALEKFEDTILDALPKVFGMSCGAYWELYEAPAGERRGDKYFRLIEHSADKFEFLVIGFKRIATTSPEDLHHQLTSRLHDHDRCKKQAKEEREFQNEVLNQIAVLQTNQRVPRRLILGKQNYAVFQRIKQKYPNYPEVIVVDGREQRWGMQIEPDETEDRLEVLP